MKIKKNYKEPEISFTVFSNVDILTESPEKDEWDDENVKDDGWL